MGAARHPAVRTEQWMECASQRSLLPLLPLRNVDYRSDLTPDLYSGRTYETASSSQVRTW